MARVVTVDPVGGLSLPTDVVVADSLSDFHRHLKSVVEPHRNSGDYVHAPKDDWSGGRTWDEAMSALVRGDAKNVAAAEALEREVSHLLDWSARKFVTVNSVAGGGALNVGAWLAGQPQIVRQRVRVEDDSAPLTVVVANNSASRVSAKSLVRRGSAILALVRLLSATRPVTLWSVAASPVNGPRNTGMAVKIETAPLVLGHAAFVLSDPAFARILGFATRACANNVTGGHNDFPPLGGSSSEAKRLGGLVMAGALNVPVADVLYIPRAGEADDGGLTNNPTAWLADMLKAYGRFGEGTND